MSTPTGLERDSSSRAAGIGLPDSAYLRIADCTIDTAAHRIVRGSESTKLEPKVMELLIYLAEHPGEVVTREALESVVWAGTIVSYDAVTGAIQKLRRAFNDDPKNPEIIETISKRGYRLIAPVETTTEAPAGDSTVSEETAATNKTGSPVPRVWLLAIPGFVLLLGFAIWLQTTPSVDAPATTAAAKAPSLSGPAIAILPFANISGDAAQDYFANGITQDLITLLANVSGLSIVAPFSVFAYKDEAHETERIGRELGVRYLLSGTIRRVGDRIRVNAELLDATNRQSLWAERYDRRLEDVFAVQDEVTQSIVAALASELLEQPPTPARSSHVPTIEAYDRLLRGLDHYTSRSREGNETAQAYYLEAIALDPKFARAYSALSLALMRDAVDGWGGEHQKAFAEADRLLDTALSLDGSLAQVHFAKSQLELFRRDHAAAIREAELAIQLSPSYADGHGVLAWVLNYAGRPQDALPHLNKARQLNPRFPMIYRLVLGSTYFNLEDFQLAIQTFREALAINPAYQRMRLWLISAYGNAGMIDDAQWEIEELKIQTTPPTPAEIEQSFPFLDPAHADRFVTGLRTAGLFD